MSNRLRHPLILRGLLAERGLSYQEFADRLGCHKGTVSRWCLGSRKTMSNERAQRVLEVLGVTRAQLFTDPASSVEANGDPCTGTAA